MEDLGIRRENGKCEKKEIDLSSLLQVAQRPSCNLCADDHFILIVLDLHTF